MKYLFSILFVAFLIFSFVWFSGSGISSADLRLKLCELLKTSNQCDPFREYILAHHEKVPNFAIKPNIYSAKSGNWSDPEIWKSNKTPSVGDVVLISSGHRVTYDSNLDDAIDTIGVAGHLDFSSPQKTRLHVTQLVVFSTGILSVGTISDPVESSARVSVVFNDRNLITEPDTNKVWDPEQFGNGLLVFGKLLVYGKELKNSFVRLEQEVGAGDTVFATQSSLAGWKSGDRILLPASRPFNEIPSDAQRGDTRVDPGSKNISTWEILNIDRVSYRSVVTKRRANFDHPKLEVFTRNNKYTYTPHMANLTRNIVFESENPESVRGHLIFFRGATVKIHGAHFLNLGRTTVEELDNTSISTDGEIVRIGKNQIARYPIHMHHLTNPDEIDTLKPTFEIVGNVVEGARRWGVSIHASHFGLVKDNVVVDVDGAGIVTEDGSETGNVIESNFVAAVTGSGLAFDARLRGEGVGHEGAGFWLGSDNNIIRDNVVAGVGANGFTIFRTEKSADFPDFSALSISGKSPGIRMLEISGNEVYAAAESGVKLWSTKNCKVCRHRIEVIENTNVWNSSVGVSFDYHADYYSFDNLSVVASDSSGHETFGIVANASKHAEVRNASIVGVDTGVEAGGQRNRFFTISDSVISAKTGIRVLTPANWSRQGKFEIKDTVIDGSDRLVEENYIELSRETSSTRDAKIMAPRPIYLTNFQKSEGADYQLFRYEQSPDYVLPSSTDSMVGCPESNLTNTECNVRYGVSYGGEVAPCDNEIRGVAGFTCRL